MTREQIRTLMAGMRSQETAGSYTSADPARAVAAPAGAGGEGGEAPLLPPAIRQFHLPATGSSAPYHARLAGAAEIAISSIRYGIEERRQCLFALDLRDGEAAANWDSAERLPQTVDEIVAQPAAGARFAVCPAAAARPSNYTQWEKQFRTWLRRNEYIRLQRSEKFRMTSIPEESEGEFRARLQQTAAEQRDQAIAKVRKRYATKATALENRLLRARQAIERESGQSGAQMVSTAVSFGTAILGAVLGRKRLSASTASRVGTAIRSAGSARKQASDVARARGREAKVQADIERLNDDLEAEVAGLDTAYDAQAEELTEILVKPKAADVHVLLFGLLWHQRK